VANDADFKTNGLPNDQSVDYAIELLTFAATDYSKANLSPSAEEFTLIVKLVQEGFIRGTVTRDEHGEPQAVLCEEITATGRKFLAQLGNQKKSRSPRKSFFASLKGIRWHTARHPGERPLA